MKKCKICQKEKPISEFSTQKSRGKNYINNVCLICNKQQQQEYRDNNKEDKKKRDKAYYESVKNTPEFIEKSKKYRDSRKEEKSIYDKEYRKSHKEEYKLYCEENKEEISKSRNKYYLDHKKDRQEYNKIWYANNKQIKHKINSKYIVARLKEDVSFRLRLNVSKTIGKYLKLNNSSKNGNSILQFLPYSIRQLKSHLEEKFESWMSWQNYGTYRVDIWNDNDPTTWTWQIDHIIPQSTFKYTSMEDEEFKKCWALDNLRPYSAKQNLLDSNRK